MSSLLEGTLCGDMNNIRHHQKENRKGYRTAGDRLLLETTHRILDHPHPIPQKKEEEHFTLVPWKQWEAPSLSVLPYFQGLGEEDQI